MTSDNLEGLKCGGVAEGMKAFATLLIFKEEAEKIYSILMYFRCVSLRD